MVGGKGHLQIWDDIMKEIHIKKQGKIGTFSHFSTDGLSKIPYCKDSGALFSSNCFYDIRGDRMDYGYFTHSSAPSEICRRHVLVPYGDVYGTDSYDGRRWIALIDIPERIFPAKVNVKDNEYVYGYYFKKNKESSVEEPYLGLHFEYNKSTKKKREARKYR